MSYIIEDRQLAARTRYQVRLFLRTLKAADVDEQTMSAATRACAPLMALLAGVVEDDVPTE